MVGWMPELESVEARKRMVDHKRIIQALFAYGSLVLHRFVVTLTVYMIASDPAWLLCVTYSVTVYVVFKVGGTEVSLFFLSSRSIATNSRLTLTTLLTSIYFAHVAFMLVIGEETCLRSLDRWKEATSAT